jgi:hypothetical protein
MLDQKLLNIAAAGLLALISALFWGYIFYKKQPENKQKVFSPRGAIKNWPITPDSLTTFTHG